MSGSEKSTASIDRPQLIRISSLSTLEDLVGRRKFDIEKLTLMIFDALLFGFARKMRGYRKKIVTLVLDYICL
jgi:hypothetical protein